MATMTVMKMEPSDELRELIDGALESIREYAAMINAKADEARAERIKTALATIEVLAEEARKNGNNVRANALDDAVAVLRCAVG